jgi:hypothetical protein
MSMRCAIFFVDRGRGRDFTDKAAPDLNFGMFHCFEIEAEFDVGTVLPSPVSDNVANGMLYVSGIPCLSICTESQFCHPPGMQGAPSL